MPPKRTIEHYFNMDRYRKKLREDNLAIVWTFAQLPDELKEIIFAFAFAQCDGCKHIKCQLTKTTQFDIYNTGDFQLLCPECYMDSLSMYSRQLKRIEKRFMALNAKYQDKTRKNIRICIFHKRIYDDIKSFRDEYTKGSRIVITPEKFGVWFAVIKGNLWYRINV